MRNLNNLEINVISGGNKPETDVADVTEKYHAYCFILDESDNRKGTFSFGTAIDNGKKKTIFSSMLTEFSLTNNQKQSLGVFNGVEYFVLCKSYSQ